MAKTKGLSAQKLPQKKILRVLQRVGIMYEHRRRIRIYIHAVGKDPELWSRIQFGSLKDKPNVQMKRLISDRVVCAYVTKKKIRKRKCDWSMFMLLVNLCNTLERTTLIVYVYPHNKCAEETAAYHHYLVNQFIIFQMKTINNHPSLSQKIDVSTARELRNTCLPHCHWTQKFPSRP